MYEKISRLKNASIYRRLLSGGETLVDNRVDTLGRIIPEDGQSIERGRKKNFQESERRYSIGRCGFRVIRSAPRGFLIAR